MQSRFTIAALPRTFSLATALAAALICTTPSARANIDTSAAASTPFGFFGSGPSNISSFGQTITAGPVDSQLNSFSFWTSALDLDVMAFVTVWHAENPAVQYMDDNYWASEITSFGDGFSGYRQVTVQTGGITLAANQHYVLMLTSSGLSDDPTNHNSWLKTNADAYSGGSFVYTSVQENSDQMFSTNPAGWDCGEGRCAANANGQDLVFSADISAIPEPATSGLLFAGLAVLIGLGPLRNSSRSLVRAVAAQAPR
jgi:hypothetical protein